MHLGKEIETEEITLANGDKFLSVDVADNAGLNGHLLMTFSLNVRLADLWHDHGKAGGAGKATPDSGGQNPNYNPE